MNVLINVIGFKGKFRVSQLDAIYPDANLIDDITTNPKAFINSRHPTCKDAERVFAVITPIAHTNKRA